MSLPSAWLHGACWCTRLVPAISLTTTLSGLYRVMLADSPCPWCWPNPASHLQGERIKKHIFFSTFLFRFWKLKKKCRRRRKSCKKEELNGGPRRLHGGGELQHWVQWQHLITAVRRSQFVLTNKESYLNVIIKCTTIDTSPSHLQRNVCMSTSDNGQ